LRLPDDAPIPFSLTRTRWGGVPLDLKIKKMIKNNLFSKDDDFSE
jgi:hypothetical protein